MKYFDNNLTKAMFVYKPSTLAYKRLIIRNLKITLQN